VKRDDDLLREILFSYKKKDDWLVAERNVMGMSAEQRKRLGHVYLLRDAGLIADVGRDTYRLTNAGHDYLEAVRDPGVWEKTKATVSETGGAATLEIVKALAVGFLKKKISQHTDIEL
jgi:hypothetical protein